MLGVQVNFETGAVRLMLGYESIGLSPNFTNAGFPTQKTWSGSSPVTFSKEKYKRVDVNLWREFSIEQYKQIRPLLPIPYLTQLGDFPPVVIVDDLPLIYHTREPVAKAFLNLRKCLSNSNLLPLVVTAKDLRSANMRLKDLTLYPRERPLLMVLDDEDTLPLHGEYRKYLHRPEEMSSLHELSLLKHWALGIYETINFGEREDLIKVVRLEGKHYE